MVLYSKVIIDSIPVKADSRGSDPQLNITWEYTKDDDDEKNVNNMAIDVQKKLEKAKISCFNDSREQFTPGWKFNEWELKGIPLRIEIGPRDFREGKVILVRRDTKEKISIKHEELIENESLYAELFTLQAQGYL